MSRRLNIAIDGPAASGKSTTARLLAEKLGYRYIDTGAMYRAATKAIIDSRTDPDSELVSVAIVDNIDISIELINHQQRTFLNNIDVTEQIRTPEIDRAISAVSSYPGIRKIMVAKQQLIAGDGGVVMDGRDIGTVVLPEADLKIFLVASIKTRARRRLLDLEAADTAIDIEEVKADLKRRDHLDSTRKDSPLLRAADSRELDTSQLSISEQVETIYDWVISLPGYHQ